MMTKSQMNGYLRKAQALQRKVGYNGHAFEIRTYKYGIALYYFYPAYGEEVQSCDILTEIGPAVNDERWFVFESFVLDTLNA